MVSSYSLRESPEMKDIIQNASLIITKLTLVVKDVLSAVMVEKEE
jgi:hypothetical protein